MPEDIFRWVVAAAVVLAALSFIVQAILVFGLYRTARTMQQRVTALADRVDPILESTRRLVEENRSKIAEIGDQALEITRMGKAEVARISMLVGEVSDRARLKIASLDSALDDAAGSLQNTATSVRYAVLRPMREVHGLLAGFRAGLGALVYGRQETIDRVTQDEEMFI